MMTPRAEHGGMKTLTDQLAQYADYHRDRRNIATHLVGIPMIVIAVAILASRPVLGHLDAVALSPATLLVAASVAYYLRLHLGYGLVMGALMAGAHAIGQALAAEPTGAWLGWGLGLFAVGWVIQFIGHAFEGRKPAFVDDVIGLVIGPLFVVAEVGFALHLGRRVQAEVEARVGPTRVGRRTMQACS